MTRMKPVIVSAEVDAEWTGLDVGFLKIVQADITRMLNDKESKAKVDRLYYSGRLADITGFEWYMDPEK